MEKLRTIELILLLINTQACIEMTGEFVDVQRSIKYKLQKEIARRDDTGNACEEAMRISPDIARMFVNIVDQIPKIHKP